MLKLIGSSVVLIASTIGGIIYAQSYIYRFRELNEVERCICELENEIVYTHTPLPEALKNIASRSEKPISEIFKNISTELASNCHDSVYEVFKEELGRSKNIYLKTEDVNIILDLAKSLGESDIDGQVNIFLFTINNLKKVINDAEIAMKKNVKMFRYLGFSIGAMIVIMLI
ncbi:stage III sporulation protein AB [Clostridium acidisoli DSM 12555]|uniref:Stage III sporulation protein AB n=1 Tax=Clostridium acidisoli DSM 12555 TaxID=1121291 RepID=A0A1W1X0W8_9CLOT|nr:stage III sporulation protein SpoIIIAB [Clostridium acidisoli]SMC17592.1 stage III sporulation protein AB [Clostridium acidisoli DSM 12555]